MPLPEGEGLPGEIFEECAALSIGDLTRIFAVDERRIVEWTADQRRVLRSSSRRQLSYSLAVRTSGPRRILPLG